LAAAAAVDDDIPWRRRSWKRFLEGDSKDAAELPSLSSISISRPPPSSSSSSSISVSKNVVAALFAAAVSAPAEEASAPSSPWAMVLLLMLPPLPRRRFRSTMTMIANSYQREPVRLPESKGADSW
jgi:hypothetical protein